MTEDMVGGPHQEDERIRAEQSCWSTQNKTVVPVGFPSHRAPLRSRTGVHRGDQNHSESLLSWPTSLDISPEFPPEFRFHHRISRLPKTTNLRLELSYFAIRKLPITRTSIPELKNVQMASVGVHTIASPRRLNDVFITTGTPVRFPNSSITRQ